MSNATVPMIITNFGFGKTTLRFVQFRFQMSCTKKFTITDEILFDLTSPSEDTTGGDGEGKEKVNNSLHGQDSNPSSQGTKHSANSTEQGLLKVPRIGSVEDLDADEIDIGPVPSSESSIR